jgi:hypothetical protein
MSIQQVNGDPVTSSSTNNDGGSAIRVGSTNKMSSISSANTINTGGIVNNNHIDPILEDGVFANNNFNPVGKKITNNLAGIENDYLLSGALRADLVTGINSIESRLTTQNTSAIRENKYDRLTNSFSEGFPVVSNDNFGSDFAARMTDSYRGTLFFNIGNPRPTYVNYSAPGSFQAEPPEPPVETFRLLSENNLVLKTENNQPLSIEE